MPDYKKMYTTLFQSQTKAINILQQAHLEVEDMYIETDETPIQLLPKEQRKPPNDTKDYTSRHKQNPSG